MSAHHDGAGQEPDHLTEVSAVWLGLDGDQVVMAHFGEYRKVRNLRRDPRIALCLNAEGRNAIGMQHSLILRGTATITEGGAADVLRHLRVIYGADYPIPDDPPPGYVVLITVDRVTGLGPW